MAPSRKLNRPALIAALVSLVVGALMGVYVTRQRYKAKDVIVAVNGVTIDKSEFFRRMENKDGDATIREMVGEELQYQFANKLGKIPTDAAVDAKLEELMKQPGFEAKLEATHLSLEDIRRVIRIKMAQQAVLTRDVPVTEAEAHRFYEQNSDPKNPKALFYTPDTAEIEVIITKTRAEADRALIALNGRVPFETAVALYSSDQSREHNGILPPILRGRTTSVKYAGLEKILFALKIGAQTGPLEVAHTWWIIRCMDRHFAVTGSPVEKALGVERQQDGERFRRFPAACHGAGLLDTLLQGRGAEGGSNQIGMRGINGPGRSFAPVESYGAPELLRCRAKPAKYFLRFAPN